MSSMNAVGFKSFGGVEVTELLRVPIPRPAAGEVQVKVAAGGLNPYDKIQRAGLMQQVIPIKFPAVAGNELSGTITAVGQGVTGLRVGYKIVSPVGLLQMGAYAEHAVVPASLVASAPTSNPLSTAAGLPVAGHAASQAIDRLGVVAGDKVLITGDAGGVGLFAIQLAKLRGAHVTTTASETGRPHVLKAGVDVVIDYNK